MIKKLKKPLNLAYIGGGNNSSIGNVHFIASKLDSNFTIMSGFFSRDKIDNYKKAKKYNLNKNKV